MSLIVRETNEDFKGYFLSEQNVDINATYLPTDICESFLFLITSVFIRTLAPDFDLK